MPKSRKILKMIVMLSLALLLFATPSRAAWDIDESIDNYSPGYLKLVSGTIRLLLDCTSDASGTTYTVLNPDVRGAYLYAIVTDPDGTDVPTGTYNITVTDDLGTTWHTATGRSTTAIEVSQASSTVGVFPCLFTTKLTFTTLGDTKKTRVWLIYVLP